MQITVTPRQMPECSSCGQTDNWTVVQKNTRDSKLIRVDGLGDLVVEKPDALLSRQVLGLICGTCGVLSVPQPEIEAWYEGGGEDGFGWNTRSGHDGEEE